MTATKNGFSEENFYGESRQLFETYRESLRGWMVRDAHSELEKAINNCVQNVIDHVENEKIPSERLPPNLRDPTTSTNFVKFFAAQSMIETLVGVTIGAAKRGHTEPVERLCGLAYETCAVLRDILAGHSGTDAQREILAEIAKVNSAFPLLFRRHNRANKDATQALERMGWGKESWISTDQSKKYGVDSELNRYLVRLIPHVQRFCQIDIQGSIHQNALFELPMLENFSDPETAKRAFNNAKELFLKGGRPRPATAQVWVKDVFVPLTKAGFGDPFDLPIVPNISEKKLRGTGDKDKTDRSPDERLHHYVLKALHGMLRH